MHPRARIAALSLAVTMAAPAAAVTLYDAAAGSLPAAQGWLTAGAIVSAPSVAAGLYTMDTSTHMALQYGHALLSSALPGPVPLNTAAGFDLGFSLRVVSETHAHGDRAGFSLIVGGADPVHSLEIGFWGDRVWVYDYGAAGFVRGTGVGDEAALDTSALRDYTLSVRAQQYTLSSGATPLLYGSLRDYTGSALAPYNTANLIFFGDDTSSASAAVQLGRITLAPVPEPVPMALLLPGLAALLGWRRLRRG